LTNAIIPDFLTLDFQASKKNKDSNKAMVGAVCVSGDSWTYPDPNVGPVMGNSFI